MRTPGLSDTPNHCAAFRIVFGPPSDDPRRASNKFLNQITPGLSFRTVARHRLDGGRPEVDRCILQNFLPTLVLGWSFRSRLQSSIDPSANQFGWFETRLLRESLNPLNVFRCHENGDSLHDPPELQKCICCRTKSAYSPKVFRRSP